MIRTSDNTPEQLRAEQVATLAASPRKHGLLAKMLFRTMDLIYGRTSSLSKFMVLEVVARVPYQAWQSVAFVAITHTHPSPSFARNIHDEVAAARAQQDNELFHLLIIEELLQRRDFRRQGRVRYRAMPQLLAWIYYHVSWLLYVIRPQLSYQLNADFEDHAERAYFQYVADHPELDDEPWVSEFADDYGSFDTVADLLRQIALDERHHKLESLERIDDARFGA